MAVEVAKEGLETNKQVVEIRNDKVPPVNMTIAKEVAKADPTVEINAAVAKAAELAQAGKIPEARKIYEDMLAKYPTVYQLEGLIARTYAVENQPAKALEHVNLALEKEPTNVEMKVLKADLMMETGDKVGAGNPQLGGLDAGQGSSPVHQLRDRDHQRRQGRRGGRGARPSSWRSSRPSPRFSTTAAAPTWSRRNTTKQGGPRKVRFPRAGGERNSRCEAHPRSAAEEMSSR